VLASVLLELGPTRLSLQLAGLVVGLVACQKILCLYTMVAQEQEHLLSMVAIILTLKIHHLGLSKLSVL
jgi:hypothetical protein